MRSSSIALIKRANPTRAIFDVARASSASKDLIQLEKNHAAHNYAPLPVVFRSARGCVVQDPEGRKYFDFLGGYGTVSQGHLHPTIVRAVLTQINRCTLSSRAFHSDVFARFAQFATTYFGYDKVLAMNTGAEAVETAIKIARRWGYEQKKIKENEALIVCCSGNFHGRTTLAISMSDDPTSYGGYGPKVPGILRVPFGDTDALRQLIEKEHKNIAGFIVEPVQGEAGVIIPPKGYIAAAAQLCKKYNVLFIADEVQCGLGRTGKLYTCQHENVRPDILIFAKALGGGLVPISIVLADDNVMSVITPGTHGSTFGGNPLASAAAIAALTVIHKQKLVENAAVMGRFFLEGLQHLKQQFPDLLSSVRGKGLLVAMEFHESILSGEAAHEFVHLLLRERVLAKVTHGHIVRMSPPLIIKKKQLRFALGCIRRALAALKSKVVEKTTTSH